MWQEFKNYYWKDSSAYIYWGDTLEELKKIPDESIDCIITSPPYWGLRDYGVDGQIGLEPTLDLYIEHMLQVTAELKRVLKKTGVMFWNHGDNYNSQRVAPNAPKLGKRAEEYNRVSIVSPQTPQKCLALQNYRLILKMLDDDGDDIYELRDDLTEEERRIVLTKLSEVIK